MYNINVYLLFQTAESHFNDIEKECVEYVAGYIAYKFFEKYPHLTSSNRNKSWIDCVSRGGLKTPSDDLLTAMKLMETDFKMLHGDKLSKSSGIMTTLSSMIKSKIQHLNLPQEVVMCMVRTRTFIRLNNMNREMKCGSLHKKLKKFTS